MYDHTLRVYDEYLAKDQTMPNATELVCNQGTKRNASGLGSAEILIAAAQPVTLAASKSFTLRIEDSADGVEFKAVPVTFKRILGDNPKTWEEGEELGRLPIPTDCRAYLRALIGSDDDAASGSVDVVFSYLPR